MSDSLALRKILAALAAETDDAAAAAPHAMTEALSLLNEQALGAPRRLKILELFLAPACRRQDEIANELMAATLPLAVDLRLRADLLVRSFGLLARGFLDTLANSDDDALRRYQRNPAHIRREAMRCWHRQMQISALIGAAPPDGLWRLALDTLQRAEAMETNQPLREEFGRMLALAVAQPESHTPREVALLIGYLKCIASPVVWHNAQQPVSPHVYWFAPAHGLPPSAAARRRPAAPEADIRFFDCAEIAKLARHHLEQLTQGTPPAALGLPPALAAEDYRSVLADAAQCWAAPLKRRHGRRAGNYRVDVCAHSGTLWRMLGNDRDAVAPDHSQTTSSWLVINESAHGYAMLHVAGPCAGLRVGAVLGMRDVVAEAWRLCLVRWAKSDNPEHVELGLELLSPSARAVRLAFRGGSAPVPALWLPALPALGRGDSLLTARGQFNPGAFTLLADDKDGVSLADCESDKLRLRTSSIEVFEFSRRSRPE